MADNDDEQSDEEVSSCKQNIIKIIIIISLTIIAIGCSITLAIVLYKQIKRERVLQAKKTAWTARMEECAPILKVAGPIILNVIKVAFSILFI